MFLPSTEWLLMAAAVALYLYDAAVPLYSNEGILGPVGRKRWQVAFGSERFQWRGKEIFLPNPFTPHRPLWRLCWSTSGNQPAPLSDWTPTNSFSALAPLIWSMSVALFVLLPLGLFSRFGDRAIVAAIVCFYASALAALGAVWFRRENFQCSTRQFLHLAFESLTCPPFALNIIRHLALAQNPRGDLARVAYRLQQVDDWEDTRQRLIERVQTEISWTEDKPELIACLHQYIADLRNGFPAPHTLEEKPPC